MEIKLQLNGKIDDSGVDFDNLDYTNADDIANGSKGIFRLYIYNKTTKKWRYEYYLCKVIENTYLGKLCNHNFKLEIVQVLNGNKKVVGDIISRNGKQLYKNYYEIRKANKYCRFYKHKQKYNYSVMIGVI